MKVSKAKYLTPIIHNLRTTRTDLVELLDLIRMNAEDYNTEDVLELAKKFISNHQIKQQL